MALLARERRGGGAQRLAVAPSEATRSAAGANRFGRRTRLGSGSDGRRGSRACAVAARVPAHAGRRRSAADAALHRRRGAVVRCGCASSAARTRRVRRSLEHRLPRAVALAPRARARSAAAAGGSGADTEAYWLAVVSRSDAISSRRSPIDGRAASSGGPAWLRAVSRSSGGRPASGWRARRTRSAALRRPRRRAAPRARARALAQLVLVRRGSSVVVGSCRSRRRGSWSRCASTRAAR